MHRRARPGFAGKNVLPLCVLEYEFENKKFMMGVSILKFGYVEFDKIRVGYFEPMWMWLSLIRSTCETKTSSFFIMPMFGVWMNSSERWPQQEVDPDHHRDDPEDAEDSQPEHIDVLAGGCVVTFRAEKATLQKPINRLAIRKIRRPWVCTSGCYGWGGWVGIKVSGCVLGEWAGWWVC